MIALPTGDTVRAVAMVGVVVLAAAPAGRPARGGGRQLGTGPPEMDRTRPRLAAGAAADRRLMVPHRNSQQPPRPYRWSGLPFCRPRNPFA